MKYAIESIEITVNEDGGDTVASAKCVLVANETKRKLATSVRITAAQKRGAATTINAGEEVASKLGRLAQRKAVEAGA